MEALVASHHGPPSTSLSFIRTPEPLPPLNSTHLRIRVHYAEVNPVDVQKLTAKPAGTAIAGKGSLVVGYGGSGVIEEIGSDALTTSKMADSESWLQVGSKVAFLCDARFDGSFASHVSVDVRLVAPVPNSGDKNISMAEAASIPLSGCTAAEALGKVGFPIFPEKSNQSNGTANQEDQRQTLLVVGGAGGVGSWTILLARACYPNLQIIATASSPTSKSWCLERLGAHQVINHDEIDTALEGGRTGSVDSIICLTEPTPTVFSSLANVLKPYGKICLVVAGQGIKSLDLSFVFFKGGMVATETVFSQSRSGFDPAGGPPQGLIISEILGLLSKGCIDGGGAPLVNGWNDVPGAANWNDSLQTGGVMDLVSTGHTRGKLVMRIAGDE